jgi:hypothetical protein
MSAANAADQIAQPHPFRPWSAMVIGMNRHCAPESRLNMISPRKRYVFVARETVSLFRITL